jgi:thiol-disulfide isomerase/thioredoxin
MERLYQQLDNNQFVVLAVDLREQRDIVRDFADDLGLTFPILLDSQGITGSVYGVRGIPTTFLIDKDGKLVARLVGSKEWDTPEFADIIRQLINE